MKKIILVVILLISSFSVQSQNLNELFHPTTIGLNKEYLEKRTGPAKRVWGNTYQYEVNGCNVDIVYLNNTVQSIALRNISKKCSFDASNIYLSGPIENVTFGDIGRIIYQWKAYESCIGVCGNAADPERQMWGETPRAYGNIKFIVGTTESAPAFNMRDDILKMYTNLTAGDFSGGYLGTKIQWQPYYYFWQRHFKNEKIMSIKIEY
jgi:hypothetical protein